jgi:hypothetical protein
MIKVKEVYEEYLRANIYQDINSCKILSCPFKQRITCIADTFCVDSCMLFCKEKKYNDTGFYIYCVTQNNPPKAKAEMD